MTLPVTLADAPALPRVAETASAAPVTGDGGTAFAETLAGVMGPSAGTAAGTAAKPVAGEAAPAEAMPDAEAMLADLGQRAVTAAGMAAQLPVAAEAAPAAVAPVVAGDGAVAATDAGIAEPAGPMSPSDTGVDMGMDATGLDLAAPPPETGAEGEMPTDGTADAEEVPIDLSLATLLAVALPPPADATGEMAPVATQDAAVEAAQRAMAASMALPGLVKPEKGAKSPTDGPDAPEAATGFEAVAEEEVEMPAAKPAGNELRPAVVPVAQAAAEGRTGGEARREAVAEIALAAAGGAVTEVSGAATGTTSGATGSATGPGVLLPGGPIQTGRPGWEGVLADRIAAELSGDGKEIELDLAPETLGQLKIRLEVVDGLAQVRIVTETPEAARLFQQAEHRLSENLSRAGLSLGGQDTTSRDAQSGTQSGQAQGQSGQGGNGPGDRGGRPRGIEMHFDRQGVSALAEQAGRAGRGLVNLIA